MRLWVGVVALDLNGMRTSLEQGARAGIQKKAGITVAKVIEFYIPSRFRKSVKWVAPEARGKIIEFVVQTEKSA
jgi:hypothetical protein